VVLISPKIVDFRETEWNNQKVEKVSRYQRILNQEELKSKTKMAKLMDGKTATADESNGDSPSYRE
jgi:hypothetical protein